MSFENTKDFVLSGIGINNEHIALVEKIKALENTNEVEDVRVFKFAYAPIGDHAVLTLHIKTKTPIDRKSKIFNFFEKHGLEVSEAVGNRSSFNFNGFKLIIEFM